MSPKQESKSKDKHSLLPQSWTNHHILLAIIVLQVGFMIFMSLQGPAGHDPHSSLQKMASRNTRMINHDELRQLHHHEQGAQAMTPRESNPLLPQKKLPIKRKPKAVLATTPPRYKDLMQVKEWDVDSHVFPGALHFHFQQERMEPFFRSSHSVTVQSLQAKVEQAAKDAASIMVRKKQKLTPCLYYTTPTTTNNKGQSSSPLPEIRMNQECFKKGHKHNGVLIYNPQPFPRIFCGKTLQPNKVQHIRKLCEHASTEPSRLLLESDNLQGIIRRNLRKLPPVVFNRVDSYASVEAVKDCDVPCRMSMDTCMDEDGKEAKGEVCLPEVSDWTVEGTNFKFKYSMLDPRNAPSEIGISRKAYRDNQYYATRSFQSEIPLTKFDWDRYGEMNNAPRNDFKKSAKKGMVFIHLEPCTGEIRPSSWAAKLVDAFKGNFDYFGPCKFRGNMAAKDTKLDVNKYQDRQAIMSEYMFTLVIGHSLQPDIISELVWDALMAGSIPVYHGAPNIREHVPKHSIIVASDYSSQQTMASKLDKVSTSKTSWERYHAWRDDDKATSFMLEKYGFMKDKSSTSYCRMCRWALATKYSLGWNHETQTIVKPSLDRNFCVSQKDVLLHPFQEQWMSDMSMQSAFGRKVCDPNFAEQTISFDEISITRTITSHDNGVIDMAITDIKSLRNNPIVLRLNFRGINNADGAHMQHPHQLMSNDDNPSDHIPLMSSITIQDDTTRATVLVNWVTDVKTPKIEGMVDVLVRDPKKSEGHKSKLFKDGKAGEQMPRLMKDEVLRIRIIVEDVNRLRDATTEYNLSPYAHLLMSDFLEPLMFFQVD